MLVSLRKLGTFWSFQFFRDSDWMWGTPILHENTNNSDVVLLSYDQFLHCRERGGSVVECRTPEREVRGSKPTAAVLCPWARHFTPRKYWLITQEAMAPSRHDWKIVDWDVKPQHNQPKSPL